MCMCATQVLVVFKAAPELCKLLRTVEQEYSKAREHSRNRLEGPHADLLPWVQAQAQAFESAAVASVRDLNTQPAVSFLETVLFCLSLLQLPAIRDANT